MYEIFEELKIAGGGAFVMLVALYVMGAMWSYKLMMKNVQHYAAIKKMAA